MTVVQPMTTVNRAASPGSRRAQRTRRTSWPLGWVSNKGSPCRKRSSSSANFPADSYRSTGSFARHLRQIASSSVGMSGRSRRGGSGSSSNTCARVSENESESKGGAPGQDLVEHGTHSINVGPWPHAFDPAGSLLGAMYDAVPSTRIPDAARVPPALSTRRTRPKSAT